MKPLIDMWNSSTGRDSLVNLFVGLLVSLFQFNTINPILNSIGNMGIMGIALLFIASAALSYKEYRTQTN